MENLSMNKVIGNIKNAGRKAYLKAVPVLCAVVGTVSTMAIGASAEEASTVTVDTAPLISSVQAYVPAAIGIILGVGGIKIGLSFLRKQIKG